MIGTLIFAPCILTFILNSDAVPDAPVEFAAIAKLDRSAWWTVSSWRWGVEVTDEGLRLVDGGLELDQIDDGPASEDPPVCFRASLYDDPCPPTSWMGGSGLLGGDYRPRGVSFGGEGAPTGGWGRATKSYGDAAGCFEHTYVLRKVPERSIWEFPAVDPPLSPPAGDQLSLPGEGWAMRQRVDGEAGQVLVARGRVL